MNSLTMPTVSAATYDFSYNGASITVDTTSLVLKQNTYTKNFYGKQSSLITFQSFLKISMAQETMTKNSDTFFEALTTYG